MFPVMLGASMFVSKWYGQVWMAVAGRGLVRVWKKIFVVEVLVFCLRSRFCSRFGMMFHALFAGVLMVLSMLLKGTINVANRDIQACCCVCVSVDVA